MPKDNRTIIGAPRIGSNVYRDGMEDELQAAATKEQLARLTAKGAISGFASEKAAKAEVPANDDKASKPAKSADKAKS